MAKIGIIGGSGLEDPVILKNAKEIKVGTPFGEPGSLLLIGKIENNDVVLLSRHGRKHTIPPTQVNKLVGNNHIPPAYFFFQTATCGSGNYMCTFNPLIRDG